ncbi:hypothetical protein NEOLEDRAFT_715624 [Neolentinus lepideus HHB14362 ss-1]|uniref:Uncharacterized protein n=1 Tax=Neolentinus lepideus HHB14362 ss-1 TaxID=1314782 RepID=A0A165Q4P7_9AGAM|nr:hypothetical protein NEOLEDRAFT_715624 [Neolentinus lepideus HHB14362 ss-1]
MQSDALTLLPSSPCSCLRKRTFTSGPYLLTSIYSYLWTRLTIIGSRRKVLFPDVQETHSKLDGFKKRPTPPQFSARGVVPDSDDSEGVPGQSPSQSHRERLPRGSLARSQCFVPHAIMKPQTHWRLLKDAQPQWPVHAITLKVMKGIKNRWRSCTLPV